MLLPRHSVVSLVLLLLSPFARADVQPFTSYPNDFVSPSLIVKGNFANATSGAQETIRSWAESLAASGPWSVTTKPIVAPSGDKNDYMSWAPYWWPNCTGVGNTTELTPQQIWTTCPYVERDGQFNPDRLTIDDVGAFSNVSDAVLYNALAFAFENKTSSVYSQRIAKIIDTWFLDATTGMNPNLNYAQMNRGPKGQNGTHTGVLDLRGMVKVISAIVILREMKSTDWTDKLDSQMVAWTLNYTTWLETDTLGVKECASLNNHGSFCFNQWIALKLLVNDLPGAINISQLYFNGIYQGQINSTGDQPFEAVRTHPYHYRNYNLAAMITNARLYKYADPSADPWSTKTTDGATIRDALNMVMTVDANVSGEGDAVAEIYPNIAAVAAEYGDADGKYVSSLQKNFPEYASDADFLWDQPLKGSPTVEVGTAGGTGASAPGVSTSSRIAGCVFAVLLGLVVALL